MSAPAPAMTGGARRGRWIPWIFVGGFAVIVAVNAVMIALAIGTFSGLTTSEPYTKGLRFNDRLRQAEAQERLGWRVASRFTRSGPRAGELTIEIADRAGTGIAGARVTATFTRPLERRHDFAVPLAALGGGRYGARAAPPLAGQWLVRYRIERGDDVLEAAERVEVE